MARSVAVAGNHGRPSDLYQSQAQARAAWTLRVCPIVVGVSVAAWLIGRDDPIPEWITEGLALTLGSVYLVLLAIVDVHLIRKRSARLGERKETLP